MSSSFIEIISPPPVAAPHGARPAAQAALGELWLGKKVWQGLLWLAHNHLLSAAASRGRA